jgi:UDPglucose--hexose-1-phosphate uridylyltransferase
MRVTYPGYGTHLASVPVPELRHDELTGRWVLLAPGRAARPHNFPPPERDAPPAAQDCPFCPGNERMTPPEVYRTGDGAPDTPGWHVRVVPNLYPIVGGADAGPGATGAHEVAVLSPDHNKSFAQLSEQRAVEVLTLLRDRARHHFAEGRAFVQVVINHGAAAGASIAHPHAQLVALDLVPPAVQQAVDRFEAAGRDLVVADIDASAADLGFVDGPAPAWCPHAASGPYELRVALRDLGARFDDAGDEQIGAGGETARRVLGLLATVLGDVPYNLVVHTAPPGVAPGAYHWYVEVQTRIAVVAGFEQGTGILVNSLPPEVAAQQLRAVDPAVEPG